MTPSAPVSVAKERQATLFERLDDLTQRASARARLGADPEGAARGVFWVVVTLLGFGYLIQVSHASTTVRPEDFQSELSRLLVYRLFAISVLLIGLRLGAQGVARFIAPLTLLTILMLVLVYVPEVSAATNGSRRWLRLPFVGITVQPSELARVVLVLWVARRCVALGDQVREVRRYLPILLFGLALFTAILAQPDMGGALLFLLCYVCTMWVGGARPTHVAGSFGFAAAGALFVGVRAFAHIRERFAVWFGDATNEQVLRSTQAAASGDFLGVGLTWGGWRNSGLQYMQNDYAFALVGEELGFFGTAVVVGLWMAYVWFSVRLVLGLQDRFAALAAFGLLVSVAFQAMLHLQVVTGLAPPKGMNLPFLSDGGTSLVASCFAIGLALGSVPRPSRGVQAV